MLRHLARRWNLIPQQVLSFTGSFGTWDRPGGTRRRDGMFVKARTATLQLDEAHANSSGLAPDHLAVAPEMISLDIEGKLIWNADDAFDFNHRTGVREVSDDTTDPAGTVELKRPGFEGAFA
jgi:hypothetical protein